MRNLLLVPLVLFGCGDFSAASFGNENERSGTGGTSGASSTGGTGGTSGASSAGGTGGTSGTSNNGGTGGTGGNSGGTSNQEVDCMGSNLFCKEFEYCDKNYKCRNIDGPCNESLNENTCDLFHYEYLCADDENIRKAFEKRCWEFTPMLPTLIGFCCPKEMKEGGQPPPKVDCTDCKPTQFCNVEKNKCEEKCSIHQINGKNFSDVCSDSSFEYLCPTDWDGLEKAGCQNKGRISPIDFFNNTFCCKYKY